MFQGTDRDARDARALLVDRDPGERPVQEPDGCEAEGPEPRDERDVAPRDREDRAEEVLVEADVERARRGDEDDPERDPRVEDERERLVRAAPPRDRHLDRDAPTTAATSAVRFARRRGGSPAATPANATCPIPSPISGWRRCTRKKPTAGARTPTTAP